MPVPNEQTSCEEFQVALEKEATGVLSDLERGELAHHVSGCDDCQQISQLIDSLRNLTPPPSASAAMDVVYRRVARRRRELWMTAVVGAIISLAALLLMSSESGAASAVAVVAYVIVELIRKHRLDRRIAEQAQGSGEIFGKMREEIQAHIKQVGSKYSWLATMFIPASGAYLLAAHPLGWENDPSVFGTGLFVFGFGIYMTAKLLYDRRVHLPRLRRELAELSITG